MIVLYAILLFAHRDDPIDCEGAMAIGRRFINQFKVTGKPEIIGANRYSINNQPTDGWSVRFLASDGRQYRLKLDDAGRVDWFEREGGGFHKTVPWTEQDYQRAIIYLQNLRPSFILPTAWQGTARDGKHTFGDFHFSLLENGYPFVGDLVGISCAFDDPELHLWYLRINRKLPTVNVDHPTISEAEAIAAVNREYPSDLDFDRRSGTKRFKFHAPSLAYFKPRTQSNSATLVYWFDGSWSRNTGYAIQGGSMSAAIDATTGADVKVNP